MPQVPSQMPEGRQQTASQGGGDVEAGPVGWDLAGGWTSVVGPPGAGTPWSGGEIDTSSARAGLERLEAIGEGAEGPADGERL